MATTTPAPTVKTPTRTYPTQATSAGDISALTAPGIRPERLLYIDNLRLFMIVLVLVQHAAVTYSGLGSWYYIEGAHLDRLSSLLFGVYQAMTQSYFMGLLFLIAGYFVPGAYDRKGFGKFIKDRSIRLGIPALIYMLVIHPFIVYAVLASQWTTPRPAAWEYYWRYLAGGQFVSGSGPLWFAIALLIFSVVYALARRVTGEGAARTRARNVTNLQAGWLILVIALGAFLIRLVQPIGTNVLNMQLCYFSSYIALFVVGIAAYRNQWLSSLPAKFGQNWLRAGLTLGPLSLLIIAGVGGVFTHGLTSFNGGLTWQSAAFALWESFVAVSMSIGLLVLFRGRFSGQSKFIKALSDNSFAVYVYHPVVLISITLLLGPILLIPLAKFVLLVILAVPVTFALTCLVLHRIPILREVI